MEVNMSRVNASLLLFLAMIMFGSIFLDYWSYSRAFYSGALVFDDILAGTADAPQQYRILIPFTAVFLANNLHLGLRHVVALVDLIAISGASVLIISLLNRRSLYRNGDRVFRIATVLVAIALAEYYLAWLIWYQKYDTLLGVMYTSATFWLITNKRSDRTWVFLLLMILTSAVESWSRADLVVIVNGGLVVSIILFREQLRDFVEIRFLATCCACATLGAAVQLYLSRGLYPKATYGDTPLVQLAANLNITDMAVYFAFVLPVIFAILILLQRRKDHLEEAMLLVVPTIAYFLIVFVIGRIEEVRLFLPFVFPFLPATAEVIVTDVLQLRPQTTLDIP
jgi:hypothetical protein